MQITLELPDDAFAKADALARRDSRSLGSVIVELIRAVKLPYPEKGMSKPPSPGHRFPVSPGRPVTLAEIDRMLAEDGLP
jgi:hypothetical protein